MFKIKLNNVYIFIYLLIYKLLLDFVYIKFVHKLYEYERFYLDININKYFISIIMFVLVYMIIPKSTIKPSSIFLQLHFIVMLIPMFTIYALANDSGLFMWMSIICFIIQCIILKYTKPISFIGIKNSKKILYVVLITITVYVYSSMLLANGIPSLSSLNLLKVYERRNVVIYPALMGYLVSWQAKIINPFLITTSYLKEDKRGVIGSILLQLIIFAITGHRSFLLIPLAIIFILKILDKGNCFKFFAIGASGGVIGSYAAYKVFKSLLIPSLLIRRFLFVPAQIKFFYYDFFSKNKLIYFSDGRIGELFGIKLSYTTSIQRMIGEIYYGNTAYVNTGYLADAYSNLGGTGMILISIVLAIIFLCLDTLSKKIDRKLIVGLSLFIVLGLNDISLQTSLNTGGLIFLMMVLYLYSYSKENKKINLKG